MRLATTYKNLTYGDKQIEACVSLSARSLVTGRQQYRDESGHCFALPFSFYPYFHFYPYARHVKIPYCIHRHGEEKMD